MRTDAKIERFEALRLGYGPILSLTIRHTLPPTGLQSLTLELLQGEQIVSLTFTGLRQLCLADIGPSGPCVLKVLSVVQDQWEGIRYRVFNMEQYPTLAFYCADFEFSA